MSRRTREADIADRGVGRLNWTRKRTYKGQLPAAVDGQCGAGELQRAVFTVRTTTSEAVPRSAISPADKQSIYSVLAALRAAPDPAMTTTIRKTPRTTDCQ